MKHKAFFSKINIHSKIFPLVIFLVSLVFYLLYSHIMPITDPVESNYALTAKEMVLSSDWLSPRIYGNVWFDKPVLFYWLTAISFKFFGFSDFAARFTPALFAALGLAMIYWFVNKLSQPSIAFLATLVMGTSFEYVVLSKLVITDMVFFVFNSGALIFFYLGYINMDDTKRWYLGMYVSMGLAVLTKGPVGFLLPGLVMVVFLGIQRNWAELRKMSIPMGLVLFLGVTLPWYWAMYGIHGTDFLNTFLGVHNYLRATVSEHPKDNVIYYYIIVFFISMSAWSAVAIKAFVQGYKDLWTQSSSLVLFSFIWTIAYFLFYTMMATKYLTYTFPILFPVSILIAIYLDQLLVQGKTTTITRWIGIPTSLVIVLYMMISYYYLTGLTCMISISSLLVMLLFFCLQARNGDAKYVFRLICICQLLSYIVLSIFILPAITESRSGKGIAEIIAEHPGYQVGMYQFYSTSSVYYSGTIGVKLQSPHSVAMQKNEDLNWSSKYTMPTETMDDFVSQSQKGKRMIVVEEKNKINLLKENQGIHLNLLKSIDGFCYYYIND